MTNYILGTQTFTHFADLCNAYYKKHGCHVARPKAKTWINGIWTIFY